MYCIFFVSSVCAVIIKNIKEYVVNENYIYGIFIYKSSKKKKKIFFRLRQINISQSKSLTKIL
jgi:hypothetical protein